MNHYNYADIFRASDDPEEMEMWAEEMKGRIVFVSDVFTGSSDMGPTPADANLPLSGFHANAMHTILTGSFLRAFSWKENVCVEIVLLSVILLLSFKFKSLFFSLGVLVAMVGCVFIAAWAFLQMGVIFMIVRPLMMLVLGAFFVMTHRNA